MIDLSEIFKDEGLEFFNREKFSLDNYNVPEYQDKDEVVDNSNIFETLYKNQEFIKINIINEDIGLFKYFLDGSRKVYIVGEFISDDKKYLPILAGQVATACCQRHGNKLKTFELKRSNVLAFPDRIRDDKFQRIECRFQNKIKNSNFIKRFSKNIKWDICKYKQSSPDHTANIKIEDKGTAKIQEVMQSYEVELVHKIAEYGLLQENSMLIIDGSLRFERQRTKVKPEYFRNVIAIAKTFDPHKTNLLKTKLKEIGVYLKNLDFGYRTPVFKVQNKQKTFTVGTWYMRIRQQKHWKNPLDGIVKIEKLIVTNEENRDGFDSDIIDNISTSILTERNPTCYGNDNRWSSHLYPIYLTEKLIKNSFLSDTYFLNIFR